MSANGGHGGRRHKRLHHTKKIELDALRNEINVTPLVDVCLVLLIIFMVVTPLMARGKEVKLPATAHHQTENDKMQPVVAITVDGELFFDKQKVENVEILKRRVEEAWRANPEIEHRVYVKAEKELPYGKVYPVIIAMHDLGISGIDLGTNEMKKKDQ